MGYTELRLNVFQGSRTEIYRFHALKIPVPLKELPCFFAIVYFPVWSHTGEDI